MKKWFAFCLVLLNSSAQRILKEFAAFSHLIYLQLNKIVED